MAHTTRREFNRRMAAGLLGTAAFGARAFSREQIFGNGSGDKRPNFVFICSDQHNARCAGFAGHPFVTTPNLDRLAGKGVAFSSAYCGSPLCVPGRSSLMTGMYPSDVNSFCNSTVYDGSHPTWAKRMRDAGYYCWAVGKQDMNPAIDMGFVEAGVEHGHAKKPDITSLFRRPVGYRIAEREGIDGTLHTDRKAGARSEAGLDNVDRDRRDTDIALQFLKHEAPKLDKPWLAFVGLREPHPAWAARKEYFEAYLAKVSVPQVSIEELERLPLPYQIMRNFKRISTPIPEDRMRRAIAAYLGMVSQLDAYIGEIYQCLSETGQLDHTYFIYTSDHGESLGEHGMWLKNNLYEGPARIPMVIAGPGIPQGMKIDTPVGHVDLASTLLALSGVNIPAELRGTSLLGLINGKPENGPKFAYSESHSEGNPTGSFMIRKGDWKFLHFSYYGDFLFNLKEDPNELRNRIDDADAQLAAAELRALLRSRVDPEEVTERAFRLQQRILDDFTQTMNEEELFNLFKSRLGDGQARVIAKKLKNGR